MSGEKRFGSSMMGYNKTDVDTYVEIVISQCNQRLEKKDKEIAELKSQLGNVSESVILEKEAEIEQLKEKFASLHDVETIKNSEIDQLKQQLQSIEAVKNAEFESEIEQMRHKIVAFENEKNIEIEQLKQLNAELQNFKQNSEDSPMLNANATELEQIKIEVEAIVAEKDEEIDSLMAQLEVAKAQIEELKNRPEEAVLLPDDSSAQVEELNAKIVELNAKIVDLNNERGAIIETISEKDSEIEQLHVQLNSLLVKKDDSIEFERKILEEREKVARALIMASEKADNIIAQAEQNAKQQIEQALTASAKERKDLELLVEQEREKLIDVKKEVLEMKANFVSILKKYENEINQAAGEM